MVIEVEEYNPNHKKAKLKKVFKEIPCAICGIGEGAKPGFVTIKGVPADPLTNYEIPHWHPDICGKCYALLTEGHCPKCGTEFNEAKKLDWVYDQGRGFCPWLWLTCKCGLKLTLDFGGLQSADIGHIDPGGN